MFLSTAKISKALCWPISRDTKSFLTLLTRGVKLCIIKKHFSTKISAWPQECGARLVTVVNQPIRRPSTASFEFSQAKQFFFSTSWKYRRLPIWLKTLNSKGYAARYWYRTEAWTSYALSQTQEMKTFSVLNKCHSVNFDVLENFRFRY